MRIKTANKRRKRKAAHLRLARVARKLWWYQSDAPSFPPRRVVFGGRNFGKTLLIRDLTLDATELRRRLVGSDFVFVKDIDKLSSYVLKRRSNEGD